MNAYSIPIVSAAQRKPATNLYVMRDEADPLGCPVARALVASFTILVMSACSNAESNLPQADTIQPTTPIATVPAADTVFAPPSAVPNASAPAGRTNSSLTRADEANAMPLPGQNNDHSAPVMPASVPK
jgi:hypothetical protein